MDNVKERNLNREGTNEMVNLTIKSAATAVFLFIVNKVSQIFFIKLGFEQGVQSDIKVLIECLGYAYAFLSIIGVAKICMIVCGVKHEVEKRKGTTANCLQ